MNPTKLGRSRDVSERDPIRFKNPFYLSRLDADAKALPDERGGNESAREVAELIGKSQLIGRPRSSQSPYVSSGEHCTACPDTGSSTL
jgi:hypothetical protein